MPDYLTKPTRTEDPTRQSELDRARKRAGDEPVSDSALGDYWSGMQMLRIAVMNLNLADDAGRPIRTEAQITKQVDRARQALQIIACCAQKVGRKQ